MLFLYISTRFYRCKRLLLQVEMAFSAACDKINRQQIRFFCKETEEFMGNFRFKQFEIEQDRCAMKVGTDGVLLGAWAQGGRRILDIGSGTGLISLMMAQRFPEAEVVGIDMDADACGQARENVMASPFRDRVEIVCCRLQDFGADGVSKTAEAFAGTSEAAEALETAEGLRAAGVLMR